MAHFNCRVGGICVKDDHVLVIKRNTAPQPDWSGWEFCGGGLELGETPEEAIEREYKEECGIHVKAKRLFYARTGKRDNMPLLTLVYACDYQSGDVTLTGEHLEHKWIAMAELKDFDLGRYYNLDKNRFLGSEQQ